jgi:putative heme iron utilization protein
MSSDDAARDGAPGGGGKSNGSGGGLGELAVAARALMHAERHGVLSTNSVHRAGYPYGSLTPYAPSRRGAPLLLISTLAAHTKNLLADPRACLFVAESAAADDPQAGGRVSLLGRAARVADDDEADARARYLARVPQAAGYFQTHDFQLWELAVDEIRLIAGFGKIGWLAGDTIARAPARDPVAAGADGICRHMNDDHAEAVRTFCVARGADPAGARMIGADAFGFDLESSAGRLRYDFPCEVTTEDEVRRAVIALLHEARRAAAAGAR